MPRSSTLYLTCNCNGVHWCSSLVPRYSQHTDVVQSSWDEWGETILGSCRTHDSGATNHTGVDIFQNYNIPVHMSYRKGPEDSQPRGSFMNWSQAFKVQLDLKLSWTNWDCGRKKEKIFWDVDRKTLWTLWEKNWSGYGKFETGCEKVRVGSGIRLLTGLDGMETS